MAYQYMLLYALPVPIAGASVRFSHQWARVKAAADRSASSASSGWPRRPR